VVMPTTTGSKLSTPFLSQCRTDLCVSIFTIKILKSPHRYQDTKHELFGSLRVINEDRVAPRTGFGTHSHREFEIFSYVVAGELEQYVPAPFRMAKH